jgi:hypothetical protein
LKKQKADGLDTRRFLKTFQIAVSSMFPD